MKAKIVHATDDMFLASAHRLMLSKDISPEEYDTILRRTAILRVKE